MRDVAICVSLAVGLLDPTPARSQDIEAQKKIERHIRQFSNPDIAKREQAVHAIEAAWYEWDKEDLERLVVAAQNPDREVAA